MDVQLKELIEKIKIEGVKSAEERAAEIVAGAEKRASQLVEAARREAEQIVGQAKEEAARSERSGREALKQAARDLLLNLRGSITRVFTALVEAETTKVYDGKALEEAIVAVMKSWDGSELKELAVLLPEDKLKTLEGGLRARLSDELKKGLEIRPSAAARAGFVVSEKSGNAYYNFTSQAIAEVLSDYLNPRLAEIVREEGSAS